MQTKRSIEEYLNLGQYEEAFKEAASFRKNFPGEVEGEIRRLSALSRRGELSPREMAYYKALQRTSR